MDRANLYLSMDVNKNRTKAQGRGRGRAGCNFEWALQPILLARHNHMHWLSRAILTVFI